MILFHGLATLGDLNLTALTLPLTLAKKVEKVHFFFYSKTFRNIPDSKYSNYQNMAIFVNSVELCVKKLRNSVIKDQRIIRNPKNNLSNFFF